MTYNMRTYTDIRSFFGNVLPAKLARITAMTMQAYPDWFVETFQSRAKSRYVDTITLAQLLDAVHHSEEYFRQYAVDKRGVKEVANSLFIEEGWLKKLPAVAEVDGEEGYFIIGGRHRTYGIVAGLAQMCHLITKDELDAEEMFELLLQCNVLVDTVQVPDRETLVQLIKADNDSRTMRGAELAHIRTQMLGIGAEGIEGIADAAVGNENLKPKEVAQLVAQTFTRRHHKKLKPQTLQVIGEKVATWAVFGIAPGQRAGRKAEPVNPPSEVDRLMKAAYSVMCDVVSNMEVVARNANDITERIIHELETYGTERVGHDEPQEEQPAKKSSARKKAGRLEAVAAEAARELELQGAVDDIF